jgi:sugar lactone lactonase YvrE
VYIADTGNQALKVWNNTNQSLTTLVTPGLINPRGVALDISNNVYVADASANTIKKYTATNGAFNNLISAGLSFPTGVAADVAGNVYIADQNNNSAREWFAASGTISNLVSTGLASPTGVAVDGSGNLYIADTSNSVIKQRSASTGAVSNLVSSGLFNPGGVAVDRAGNVYIADTSHSAIQEWLRAFVDPTTKSESNAGGSDTLPPVLPWTENLLPPFAPTSDQPWLAINGTSNGVVSFSFEPNTGPTRTGHINLLGQSVAITQIAFTATLGTSNLVESAAAGSDSVVLGVTPSAGIWSATANDSWLHLDPAYQAGTGGGNVIFSFDGNAGLTRMGTLTIGGDTLTVIQAGATYVSAQPLTVLESSGLFSPYGIAVDSNRNVYLADFEDSAIQKWTAADNLTAFLVGGFNHPQGVAVDSAGNVYIADTGNNAVKEWFAATAAVTNLVTGLNQPRGVAVDRFGDVYFSDTGNNIIKKWQAADGTVTNLVTGLSQPRGLAVDVAGNVYFTEASAGRVREWLPANGSVIPLVSSGLSVPSAVAVDGSGNVYITDAINGAVLKWSAVSGGTSSLIPSGLAAPAGVAVDFLGNLYVADTAHQVLKEMPAAYVDPSARSENNAAGADGLPTVLPISENLLPPFAPTSDQPWLTVNGITNGVVNFSFPDNYGFGRVGNLNVLGWTIPINQNLGVIPPVLTGARVSGDVFKFSFSNVPAASFTVLSATNVSLPLSNWTAVGPASNSATGLFEFTTQTTNDPMRFYRVRSP